MIKEINKGDVKGILLLSSLYARRPFVTLKIAMPFANPE